MDPERSAATIPTGGARSVGPPVGFGKAVHAYLNQHVAIADAKAGALVAATLPIIAVLLANRPAGATAAAFHWAALGLLGLAAAVGGLAVFPRTPSGGRGLVFWEDILSRRAPEEYYGDVRRLDDAGVEQEFATQNYYLSRVLHAKYRTIRYAALLFLAGLGSVLLSRIAG